MISRKSARWGQTLGTVDAIKVVDKLVCIARYNEPLTSFVKLIPADWDVKVYNKGSLITESLPKHWKIIELPNVGRCDHTYIYHIVKEWNNHANSTLFVKASCFYQGGSLPSYFKTLLNTNPRHGFMHSTEREPDNWKMDSYETNSKNPHKISQEPPFVLSSIRPVEKWFKTHFPSLRRGEFCGGGVFLVHKDQLQRHLLSTYETILKQVEIGSSNEVGHYLERSYMSIFRDDK